MMKMNEAGLINYWTSKSIVYDPRRCLQMQTHAGRILFKRPRLTLNGLSGAFLILGAGVILSSFSFVAEFLQHVFGYLLYISKRDSIN